jgi:hypothetical protein
MTLWDSLLVRGLDLAGDVLAHPEHMDTAFEKGQAFAEAVRGGN